MPRFRAGAPVCLCAASLAAAFLCSATPLAGRPVALFFPPWWSALRAISAAAASGPVIRRGAFPFIIIVAPPRPGALPILPPGAWLALDAVALGGCTPPPVPEKT